MTTDNWISIISAILVGGGTLTLAYIAYISIKENRRIREEDRELQSKRRALDVIRNWAQDSAKLMLLNAKYSDEYRRGDSIMMQKTLEDIQNTKMKLVTMGEDVLRSATLLGREVFSTVDKAYQTLTKFVNEGMAEKTNIAEQYRYNFLLDFTNVLTICRNAENRDLKLG